MTPAIETWWIWVAAGALLMAAEIAVPGFIVFWFGIGSIAAGMLARAGAGPAVQWTAFVVVSGMLLVLRHRIMRRLTKWHSPGVGADRMVGMRGPITIAVDNVRGTGHVRLGGELWRAESESGGDIPVGVVVEVVAVEGIRVTVREVQEER